MTGRTVTELLADLALPHSALERTDPSGHRSGALNRRSAIASAAVFSLGCNFANAALSDEPVLVDGWVIRPSDIKPSARG